MNSACDNLKINYFVLLYTYENYGEMTQELGQNDLGRTGIRAKRLTGK